ncbi:MAG: hypothetical protein H0W42_11580 [Gemmatimonadaceae bacterium]|nr:hypothetical protein [Gemmatimonadaceae bacterium]
MIPIWLNREDGETVRLYTRSGHWAPKAVMFTDLVEAYERRAGGKLASIAVDREDNIIWRAKP